MKIYINMKTLGSILNTTNTESEKRKGTETERQRQIQSQTEREVREGGLFTRTQKV